MKKKINIQNDLDSRARISRITSPGIMMREATTEETPDNEPYAESETVQQPENDQSLGTDESPKKGKRKAKGDIQEV